ncbi:DUF1329 domain-containing protein [Acidovorax sp. Be4]|uniref:DUF1329 domain-containing protein n=1 Tax=Acidovorax bellezanensis TaxID=2976702 RepID=A0ABT2PKU3_9BURK|nr:DUF1329 domain-containing protein [Acidovorax sp. Be4]MCT9810845.1 DUF1329 domain-containing protein [Acidovorax sp. Be4]
MKSRFKPVLAVALALQLCTAFAAVTPDEAKQLGGPLTAFGAIKAASADGKIPEYTGGLSKPPAGFDPKSGEWPDPFKNEKPLLSITPANMAQHADKLTNGVQALLKQYPSFRIDVYPTHRTMQYPDWVLKNTFKNATTAKLAGKVQGDGVEGAYGGVPFPIPKNGHEVMWNNSLSFQRTEIAVKNPGQYLVDTSGGRSELPIVPYYSYSPYYDPDLAGEKSQGAAHTKIWSEVTAPPTMAGTAFVINYPYNYSESDQQVWVYTPGQRRVRMAPEYRYDTPYAQNGGVLFWDELALFRGRMDRFDFKLVGKKELYIPYNSYRTPSAPVDTAFGPKHINPDTIRFEQHRVWVVEATLKPGSRHAYSKRMFYIDEDSWALIEADGYDQDGKLWRVGLASTFNFYDGGGGHFSAAVSFYDLQKGNYFAYMNPTSTGAPKVFVYDKLVKANLFTPAGLAGTGVR